MKTSLRKCPFRTYLQTGVSSTVLDFIVIEWPSLAINTDHSNTDTKNNTNQKPNFEERKQKSCWRTGMT